MVRELRKAGLEHEFVEAVEGRDLDLSDTTLVDPDWLGEGPFWAGVVGCSLSHLKVYQKIVDEGVERALVLEDDVVLPRDLGALVDAVSTHMEGAEAVLLHHHRFGRIDGGEAYRFLSRGSVELPGSRILAVPTNVGDLGATGAYVITREACQRMVKKMPPVKARADDWAFFCDEGVLDTVRCVVPLPVLASANFRTTIDHYAANSIQTRLRNAIINVPVLSQALAMRRQRLMNRKTRVELVDEFDPS
jgi:glycosyl transferase family 25